MTALDPAGAAISSYSGYVDLSSTDSQVHFNSSPIWLSGGSGTFSATLKTAGTQTVTAAAAANSSETGDVAVTVNPSTYTSHFAISAPAMGINDDAFEITVTAKDSYGNVVPSYSGMVHFSSSDTDTSDRTLPADSTLTDGVGVFSVTLKAEGSQTITATDTSTGNSGSVTVTDPDYTKFSLTTGSSTVTAGGQTNVVVTVKNASNTTMTDYTGTVHFTLSDTASGASVPLDYTFTSADGGVHTFVNAITLVSAGVATLTASDTGNSSLTGSATITVSPAAVSKLAVSGPSTASAGSAFTLTVAAKDALGNTVTGYTGTVVLSTTDAGSITTAPYTFVPGDDGVHTFTSGVELVSAGQQTVTATDAASGTLTGNLAVSVSPAAAAHLLVMAPGTDIGGSAMTVTVRALDAFGNAATSYTGTVHFSSTDSSATLPSDYTFIGGGQGTHVFTSGVTLATSGSQQLTATDSGNSISGGAAVYVTSATHFAVSAPASVAAGTLATFTVSALDSNNDVVSGYTGTVQFALSGLTSALGEAVPIDYTFVGGDDGAHTFSLGLSAAVSGVRTLTATDTGDTTITGSATLSVLSGAATHLAVTPGTMTSAVKSDGFGLTVTALDQFNNVASSYSGTVHFTSSDGSATLAANYTFTSGDAGVHVFTGSAALLATTGSQTITATDTATTSIKGSAVLGVTNATHFAVGAPSSTTAGSLLSITVTAQDSGNNTAAGYTGTVHFSSSDTNVAAILPANYTFAAGSNGIAVFTGIILASAGTQTITVTDTGTSQLAGSATVTVSPAAASQLSVIAPASAFASASPLTTAFSVTVKALDPYGNTATGYTGTVHFSSTDSGSGVSLPSNYTFTSGSGHDNGVHVFTSGITLATAGSQDLIVTDSAASNIAGSAPVSVSQPTFKFSAAEYAVNETSSTVTITVDYTGPTNTSTASVHYATTDGSATNGHDYSSASGTLSFAASTSTASFTVTIDNNSIVGGSRYFTVSLSSPSSPYVINPDFGTAEVVINENDTGAFSLSDDPNNALLVPIAEAEVDPNLGAVRISQPLDFDISGGASLGGSAALVYNSADVSARPILQVQLNTTSAVQHIELDLSWSSGGSAQTATQSWTVSGSAFSLAIQVPSAVTTTGLYSWSIVPKVVYTSTPGTTNTLTALTGSTFVVAEDASPYGAGWGIEGIDKLVAVTGGVEWVTGTGDSQFFATGTTSGGTTSYTSPPENFGTLTSTGSGGSLAYVYTAADGTVSNFGSSGLLSSVAQLDGQTVSYHYDGSSRLNEVVTPDGSITNLYYGSGQVVISEPQTVTISGGPTGGSFTLAFEGSTTGSITYSTTASTLASNIQAALQSLATIGTSNCSVIAESDSIVNVMFAGSLIGAAQPNLVAGSFSGSAGAAVAVSGRDVTLNLSSGNLTSLTDATGAARQMTYNGSHQLTQDAWAPFITSFGYGSGSGLLTSVNQGLGSEWTVASAAGQALVTPQSLGGGLTAEGETASVTDPRNNTTSYVLDLRGREEQEIDANTATQVSVLNAGGLPVFYTDALGNSTQFVYATTAGLAGNDMVLQINPDGSYTAFNFNTYAYNEVSSIDVSVVANSPQSPTLADDEVTSFGYDGTADLTSVTSATGAVTSFVYGTGSSAGLMTSMTDANGDTTDYSYDIGSGSGNTRRLLSTTDPLGIVTALGYDGNGHVLTTTVEAVSGSTPIDGVLGSTTGVINSPAVTVTTNYDANGQLLSTTTAAMVNGVSSSDMAMTQYTPSGLVAATRDGNGYWTDYVYDQRGFLTQTVQAAGQPDQLVTNYTFDLAGNVISTTDPMGRQTTETYNNVNELTEETDALGDETQLEYNLNGNVTASIDANGNETNYVYDLLGDVTQVTDALKRSTEAVFDQAGNEIASFNTAGLPTLMGFDKDNRPVFTTTPLGDSSYTLYDPVGDVVSTVDANGNATELSYNADKELTSSTDAVGNVTSYAYNNMGEQVISIAPNGGKTTTAFDGSGLPTSVTDPNGNQTDYQYDHNGNLTQETAAGGGVSQTRYNDENEPIWEEDADGDVTEQVYDPDGEQVQSTDADGNVSTAAFNAAGEEVSSTDGAGDTTLMAYDKVGNLTQMTSPAGGVTSNRFNAANQLVSSQNPMGAITQQFYNLAGNEVKTIDGNGVATTQQFDADGQMVSSINGDGSTVSMAYDAAGNLIQQTNADGKSSFTSYDADERDSMQVDADGNISRQFYIGNNGTFAAGTPSYVDGAVTYDAGMRLIAMQDSLGNTTQYVYNKDNQVTMTIGPTTVTASAYDLADRQVSSTNANGTEHYGYDRNGNRHTVNECAGIPDFDHL